MARTKEKMTKKSSKKAMTSKSENSISAVVKDAGETVGYKLSNGSMVNKNEAVSLAKKGAISGVGVASRKGSEYLRGTRDSKSKNNLGELPSVENSMK